MSARVRGVALVLAGAALLGLVTLGLAWRGDRARDWEAPRWDAATFARIDSGMGDASLVGARERWVAVLQPACGHCRASVGRLAAFRVARAPWVRTAVLFVDTPAPPEAARFAGIDECWWDATGAWRERWGRRIYGEILAFDARGRHLRTFPAGATLEPLDPAHRARH